MANTTHRNRAGVIVVLLALLTSWLLIASPVGIAPAQADTAPVASDPATVSSDALPTVQIDGVAWAQLVIGNTVYVGGSFGKARPAGSAAGVNEVTRTNLLAYDLATGELKTAFNPNLNGQVRGLAASPDGATLYAVGQFTTVNGLTRNRVVAFDVATGNVTTFAPSVNSTVIGVLATANTVYLGGTFSTVNGTTRTNVASVSAATGALNAFAPTAANGGVRQFVLSPDGTKLVVGGSFTTMNGSGTPGYGLAMLDPTSGANLPMPVNTIVRDAGTNSSIMSLAATADGFYGTGYSYQKTTGNLEGAFKADWNGNLTWLEDCHGDTYSVFPSNGAVYVTGHAHYCGNVGGFPQTNPASYQRAMAFGDTVTGTIDADQYAYYNFEGLPHPKLLTWFPDFNVGTFTGQSQAAWSVAGNSSYVVYGGEFTTVNGKAQQGLVRFAKASLAPKTDGPRLSGADFVPTVRSYAQGVRVSWPANYDRDNELLTYTLVKNGNTSSPLYTTTVRSTFWQRPMISFFDRAVTPGTPVSYKISVTDPDNNVKPGDKITVTPTTGPVLSAYEKGVLADNPLSFWPLDEAAGSTAATDYASTEDALASTNVTAGVPGAIAGDPSTAYRFAGVDNNTTASVGTQTGRTGLKVFSEEAWFKTTSTRGGKVIGLGNKATGNSGNSDRQVYLGKTGKLSFGVYPGSFKTVTSASSYNDGAWHHVVATLAGDGMKLYADGVLVGSRSDVDAATITTAGYWRIGGDFMYGWPDNPSSNGYFAADIDSAAIYPYALTPAQVAAHFATPANAAPTAGFTVAKSDLTITPNAAASTDSDGYVASYAWDFGDGTTGTGVTPSHPYAAGGTYLVKLTVTDENGATGTTSTLVTVTAANALPTASFTSTTNQLAVAFDGTGSTDSDGTITSYQWNYGDGSTDTGATPSHTYLNGGTYPVTLTVTDNRGGTATVQNSVVAVAPGDHPFVSDTFDRTAASGLGSATIGGAWNVSTASGFAVGSGSGIWKLSSAGTTRTAYLGSTTKDSTDLTMNVSPDVIANGGGTYLTVLGRRVSATADYRTNIRITNANKVTVGVGALQGSSAVSLSSTVTLPGTLAAGDQIHVRMQTFGSGTTTVRTKVWLGSDTEPSAWTVSGTDSYAALQAPGSVGFVGYLSGSSTNAPVNLNVLDVAARPVAGQ